MYVEVVQCNRGVVVDYYYRAYMSYLLDDKEKCRENCVRARDMAVKGTLDPENDMLMTQCFALLWLLSIEEGHKDVAHTCVQVMLRVCTYIHMCVCVCVRVCVYIYIYIYIY